MRSCCRCRCMVKWALLHRCWTANIEMIRSIRIPNMPYVNCTRYVLLKGQWLNRLYQLRGDRSVSEKENARKPKAFSWISTAFSWIMTGVCQRVRALNMHWNDMNLISKIQSEQFSFVHTKWKQKGIMLLCFHMNYGYVTFSHSQHLNLLRL